MCKPDTRTGNEFWLLLFGWLEIFHRPVCRGRRGRRVLCVGLDISMAFRKRDFIIILIFESN